MPELNKNRIFNESSKKVLLREYENLKQDHTKMNALKYKELYENASLSFILENSRYIFSEPMKGLEFYANVMESSIIPFVKLEEEYHKFNSYVSENVSNMFEAQKKQYEDVAESKMLPKYESMKNSINLYNAMMENKDSVMEYYDALYEYGKTNDYSKIDEFLNEDVNINLMDAIALGIHVPELSSKVLKYVESAYVETPKSVEDFQLNTYTENVLSRMMSDSYISESVKLIPNMNLRHTIMGLAGQKSSDTIESITTEKVSDFNAHYSTPEDMIDRIFQDDMYSEFTKEETDNEKLNRLLCEKAIVDMNLGFALLDNQYMDEGYSNSLIEKICVESTTIEKIPTNTEDQIAFLESESNRLENEIKTITESYFTSDGSPSKVIAQSIGNTGSDSKVAKDTKDDKKDASNVYTPVASKPDDDDSKDDDKDDVDDEDEDKTGDDGDDDANYQKRLQYKKRNTDKYASMSIDDSEFDSVMKESEDDTSNEEVTSSTKTYKEIDKPEKRNIFQRIQNKAIDANIKFKRKISEGQRNATDARNAGKAVAKVPMSVSDSVKKTMSEWDEADDNRRKQYIIKPGVRKKYFKALKLCIMHYGAFAVNPILNVVLFICNKFSKDKDIRIRNELARELKAEIKVTDEKIEDAKSNGDQKQKYQLMRIRERLDAELTRVSANAKYL